MFAIFWPLAITITVVLYGLLLLFLPFSSTAATIMLYAIISFWSRLPGIGMPSPFYILYLTDLVDFFTLIIAVYVGPIPAAIFTFLVNMGSRACGVFPDWFAVFEDSTAQALVCFVIPFIFGLTGGNLVVTMVWYTVLRLILNTVIYLIIPDPYPLVQYMIELPIAGAALVVINTAYAQLFGGYFGRLLEGGFRFNWLLFLMVTVVIFYFRWKMGKRKVKAKQSKLDRKIRGWFSLRIYLIKHSSFVKKIRKLVS